MISLQYKKFLDGYLKYKGEKNDNDNRENRENK